MTGPDPGLIGLAHHYVREYLDGTTTRPAFPGQENRDVLRQLDEALPQHGVDQRATLELLNQLGTSATTGSTGGRYFGYVLGATLPIALAADHLVSAWDQSAASAETSPAAAALEHRAGRWLLDVLDLPRASSVGFVTGASAASLCALSVARAALAARQGIDVAREGLRAVPPTTVVVPESVHVTVLKAARMLGMGDADIVRLRVDGQGRVIAPAPDVFGPHTILVLQAGVLTSGAFDPFAELIPQAHAAGAWVHVDGAFGLWARASRRLAQLAEGVDQADSWSVDTHKWLNTPYDGGVFICRDAQAAATTLSSDSGFLPADPDAQRNLTPEFSRRARGVPVWAALRVLGRDGVEDLVDRCVALARQAARLSAAAGFTVLNDVVLNQVLLRCDTDEQTLAVRAAVVGAGRVWFSPATWEGRPAMRISVSSWRTTEDDVRVLADELVRAFRVS